VVIGDGAKRLGDHSAWNGDFCCQPSLVNDQACNASSWSIEVVSHNTDIRRGHVMGVEALWSTFDKSCGDR
jgi:hypothetical protein